MPKLPKMTVLQSAIILFALVGAFAKDCPAKKSLNSKLVCYYSKLVDADSCKCSHVILPANSAIKSIDRVREQLKGVKIFITVNEFNQGLVDILKGSKVDGIELSLKKLDSKSDISDFISTVRSKLGSDLSIILSVPAKAEILAKYYDFKGLSKHTDLFVLQTSFLGASNNVTFHPSRLSGLWDMQNTDSVVDLVSGLGAPLSKLVIASPVQGFRFKLQSEKHTAPGSPAVEVESITRDELCRTMGNGANWTLERDQDQAGPYIFSKDQWIAFEDGTSIDIKAKYSRVRGLAGIALKDLSQDGGEKCESSILEAAYTGLSRQARAPRGAVLHSLEREILETPARPLDKIQVSPYRISRVIDVEGNVHAIRQDTRTEFECARQGYFVHPRSCNRFYRCVKFDQLSDEFSVFEFDCPAGLAFDDRVEVCVWPGSLPHASACSGSSEIAPVPRQRFICPGEQGYYADPENCRWFFACLDHGKSPLSAYEFRCPFGLVFDESRLLCEWPWLVPKCGRGYAVGSEAIYGGTGTIALNQYDGLGVLGATALGGLQGPIQDTVSKVYSNVGTGNLVNLGPLQGQSGNIAAGSLQGGTGAIATGALDGGYGYSTGYGIGENPGTLQTGYAYNTGNLGYSGIGVLQGSSGYIGNGAIGLNGYAVGGNDGLLQSGQYRVLSLKAAQSLQNAGLLKSNGATSHQGTVQYHGGALGTGNTGDLYYGQYAANSGGALLQSSGYAGDGGAKSQGFVQYNAVSAGGVENYQNNIALDVNRNLQGAGVLIGTRVDHSDNSAIKGVLSSGNVASSEAQLINGLAYNNNIGIKDESGAKSTIEYHGNTGSGYETGTAGSINIIGGGYSAVGVLDSGIQISNNGEGSNTITHVTPSPISVTTLSSIPAVTSVPVPAIKAVTGFQSYKGGVVANIPELQYKVQPGVSNVYYQSNLGPAVTIVGSRGSSGVANVSTSYVNYVSSVPSAEVSDGYEYPKPAVEFVEGPAAKTITTSYVQNVPSLQPVVISTTATPLILQPKVAVQPIAVQKEVTGTVLEGYKYPKPGISFEETPIRTTGGFSYQQVDTVRKSEGYVYPKPSVVFEEVPLKSVTATVSPVTLVQPTQIVQQIQPIVSVKQPAYSVSTFHKQNAAVEGYTYSKPSVVFEEKPLQAVVTSYNTPSSTVRPVVIEHTPQVYVASTPAPVVVAQKIQPAVSVASFSIASQPKAAATYNYQKENSGGYYYSKPSIAFEERPAVSVEQPVAVVSQPASLSIKPAVSAYTYQNVLKQSVRTDGYSYPKPAIAFEETPASVTRLNYNLQPAVASSYSYTAPSTVKPAVLVQRQPAVTSYTYTAPSTVRPAIIVQQPEVVVQKQAPVVSSYSYTAPSTFRPPVIVQQPEVIIQKQTPVVSSYSYTAPSTVRPPVIVQQPEVIIQKQTPVVSSYSYTAPSTARPAVIVQQPELIIQKQTPVVSSYSYTAPSTIRPPVIVQQPEVIIQKQTPVVSSYSYTAPSTVRPPVIVQQPEVIIQKQTPVVSSYSYTAPSTVRPPVIVQQPEVIIQKQTPVVSSYSYTAPSTARPTVIVQQPELIIQKQTPVVSSYSYTAPSTIRPPVIVQQPEVIIQKQTPVVSSYSYTAPSTVRPAIIVQQPELIIQKQTPVVSSYSYTAPSTVRPAVIVQQPPAVVQQQTPVVSSYSYVAPSTVTPAVSAVRQDLLVQKQAAVEFNGYDYPKPVVPFVEQPAPIVTSYENRQPVEEVPFVAKKAYVTGQSVSYQQINQVDQGYVYQKPAVPFEEKPLVVESYQAPIVSSTPKTVIDYTYVQSTPKPLFINTYEASTPKPIVDYSYEYRQPVAEVPFEAKKAYVTGSQSVSYQQIDKADGGYVYDRPAVTFEERPAVIAPSTSRTLIDYTYVQPTPKPTIVDRYDIPIRSSTPKAVVDYTYIQPAPKPVVVATTPKAIVDYTYVQSTPKPTFASTIQQIAPVKQPFYFYDSRLSSTPKPVVIKAYSTPIPTLQTVTTSRPIAKYSFSSLDDQYRYVAAPVDTQYIENYVAPIDVTTPGRDYLPAKTRVRITTETPTPSREYLPVRSRVKVTTTSRPVTIPSTSYLPIEEEYEISTRRPAKVFKVTTPSTSYLPIEEEYEISTRRPAKVFKVVRPKTIVKTNDFHPLLSAKLGAQCTCVSNTVKLRKKPQRIIIEADDDDDDDGYVVDQSNDGGLVLENYQYEPQRVVAITPAPEITISSTTNAVEPAPAPLYPIKKLVRVRPATSTVLYDAPVTQGVELFVKKAVTPAITTRKSDEGPSDGEIVKAVRTGLKLVKQAAKEGAREGAEEALNSRAFDRYGPGGVRSRNERLQGTIDCQRAGLFRHPTQCNKFYACRWDCTKNRYTLHVFNCPVHLTFDNSLGACNWPSQGPACLENTLLPSD